MSDLYRLVYASKNLLQGSEVEIAQAVAQILAASQANNTRVDVTGALMFNAGAFAQVLEGPQQGVECTFERIQCDPRHGDVTVLQCGPAEGRSFTNWSMAFVGQSAAGRARWEALGSESGFDLTRLDGDAVFAMLHELVLDEEGLPVPARPAKADAVGGMDVDRVRAELPQPGQTLRARADAPMPAAAPPRDEAAPARKPDAVLSVLRTALAEERQRTTDLRNALDEARIALAVEGQRFEAIVQERDLWAKRAQLLATAMSQEAAALPARPPEREAAPGTQGHPDHPGASLKVVA